MKTLTLTNHAIKRTSQRGISHTQMEICMSFGERINKTGTEFYVLTKKCLKRLKKHTGVYMERLEGLTVICGYDFNKKEGIITAYKNKESFKIIKRKKKFKSNQPNKIIY